MGQKTHPHGFRLGFNKQWNSRWFSKGTEYGRFIHEDLKMKRLVKQRYYHAGIAEIDVERVGPKVRVIIQTARQVSLSAGAERRSKTSNPFFRRSWTKRCTSISGRSISPSSALSWWPKGSQSSWKRGSPIGGR